MSHKCTYYDEGHCLNEYGETCPYNDADEQYNCFEYEPKENYMATFTKEIIEDYKNQIKNLQEKLGKVLSQVNVSKEMTLQEAKRQGAKEFAEKLKERILHYLGVENIQQANELSMLGSLLPYDIIIDSIDESLKEHEE